jgi:uncharacterized iron-regulated membrane protein
MSEDTMSVSTDYPAQASATASSGAAAYRTLWRWHFYAAIFVMPLLVVLAITGTIYCFQPQIEPLLYPGRLVVEPAATPRLSEDALLARATAAMPPGSRVLRASIETDPRRSAEFVFAPPGGDKQSMYLNPYSGTVLGTLSVDHRFMQVDRMIHRKLLLGKPGELVMELAACWTLVMIGTGVALWWPRGSSTVRGSLLPRLALRGRPLLKSLHGALGIWLAVGALAFVLSGLPWSGSWGRQFKAIATQANLASPPDSKAELRSTLPGAEDGQAGSMAHHPMASMATGSSMTMAQSMAMGHTMKMGAMQMDAAQMRSMQSPGEQHADAQDQSEAKADDSMPGMIMDDLPLPQAPWAVGDTKVPQSRAKPLPASLSIERVMAIARSRGVTGDYDVVLPSSPTGVYTVSRFPADPQQERTLHIDRYSGAVLGDIGYPQYGPVSKAVAYGTSLHMGRYFGLANQIVCSTISLGLVAMVVTGCLMWWKRRPARALGAPSRPRGVPPMRAWKAGLVVLGVVFPLMGSTMLVVWAVDRAIFSRASSQRWAS